MLQWLRYFFHFQVAVCGVLFRERKRVQPLDTHIIQRNCSNVLSYITALHLFSLKNELVSPGPQIDSARLF